MNIRKQKKHICLVSWNKKIDAAEKRLVFTNTDRKFAGSWNVCAIGEGKKQLTKSLIKSVFEYDSWAEQKVPVDAQLKQLGTSFYESVLNNSFKEARIVLKEIENRLNKLYVLV